MKNKDYSIVRLINFILLITFLFLFKNNKIMNNYYIKIIFYIIIIIAGIYAVNDILLRIKVIVKSEEKFKFIKIIFYAFITLLFIDLIIGNILSLMHSI
ncbi:hypothetical protein K144313037_p10270 (plasmid) [Clostridium tetani]|uniref:hypothetical protein n=1 Tax=Clostridium tetani TaxID=1513 RepID=UPI000D22B088|nr:hypothetical protein [Clostridium tetani]AVP56072.1 hypothetical protein C3B72_13485 [Clostridium tetani]RXI78867.1 hypothetical protein DP128_00415 [Clostridium tetani]WFN63263.1 hypothetical protein PAA20_13910 [Clostridium tetani]SUY80160.1 Uncharacterised protein [Clostridium tetani]BDR71160.1 hypothetical protein K144313037_p10270 [Clostridium tetani]